jgi:hypothetical protein
LVERNQGPAALEFVPKDGLRHLVVVGFRIPSEYPSNPVPEPPQPGPQTGRWRLLVGLNVLEAAFHAAQFGVQTTDGVVAVLQLGV